MKVLLLVCLIFSGAAYAEWTKTGFSEESTMFIDRQTIKKNGDLIRVTYLLNFPLGTKSPDDKIEYKSSSTAEEFNCKNGSSRTTSFVWFSEPMGNGKKVYQDNHVYQFEKIKKDSLIDGIRKRICD